MSEAMTVLDKIKKRMSEEMNTLESKRGPYECPFPTAEYEKIKVIFQEGFHYGAFEHPEKALANLVGAGWRDAKLGDIKVVCLDRRQAMHFMDYLEDVLRVMNIWSDVTTKNAERIGLKDGRTCVVTTVSMTASSTVSDHTITFFGLSKNSEESLRKVKANYPADEIFDVHYLDVQCDEQWRGEAEKIRTTGSQSLPKMVGPWNSTLKLLSF
jgi:hypothetical protein